MIKDNFLKGFTLVELLVVVLIIGVLSAVALPQYRTSAEKARMTEAITNLRAIAEAQDGFHHLNDRFANAYEMEKLDVEIPGAIYDNQNSRLYKRVSTKYFMYSPDADGTGGSVNDPKPTGWKALAHRLPESKSYVLYITKNNRLHCSPNKGAQLSPVQKKLCDQIESSGEL